MARVPDPAHRANAGAVAGSDQTYIGMMHAHGPPLLFAYPSPVYPIWQLLQPVWDLRCVDPGVTGMGTMSTAIWSEQQLCCMQWSPWPDCTTWHFLWDTCCTPCLLQLLWHPHCGTGKHHMHHEPWTGWNRHRGQPSPSAARAGASCGIVQPGQPVCAMWLPLQPD